MSTQKVPSPEVKVKSSPEANSVKEKKIKRRLRVAKATSDQIEANQCPRTDHLSFTKLQVKSS